MKATPETISSLESLMLPIADKVREHGEALAKTERYTTGGGNLAMRVRWDWFWAATSNGRRDSIPQLKERDFNDEHLDTVLRQIAQKAGYPEYATK